MQPVSLPSCSLAAAFLGVCLLSRSIHVSSLLPLDRPPCSGALNRALSFMATPLDCTSPLGRALSSLSLAFSQHHSGYEPGLILQWHFYTLVHHSRESMFTDLIFLVLVFDHAYQPTMVRVSELPGGTCEFPLLTLPLF